MRPIKLTMTAFGPYRDAETVDFTRLGDRRLFVISGNTGAGKTTIFDAICFAIYGMASGEDRSDIRMLRSHFADEETHTSVELVFAAGSKQFKVFRQMKHRKGANRSETGEKTELYELINGAETPAVDRFITTEVNAKLQSILGLTKEQFSQIVMLPQGEFRKLLTSDTDNKEDILRRIFRTELYEKLEHRFYVQHRELQDDLKEARAGSSAMMRQVEEALPRREESLLAATFGQEVYNVSQVMEGLEREAVFYTDQANQAGSEKAVLSSRLDMLQEELRIAQSVNERYDELDAKKALRQGYEAKEPLFREQEQKLALAIKALSLIPYEEQAKDAETGKQMKRKFLEVKNAELANAERTYEAAMHSHLEQTKQEELRREAERELHRLTELAPIVDTLAGQLHEVEQIAAQEKLVTDKLASSELAIAECREQKNAGQLAIRSIEASTVNLAALLNQVRGIEQQGKQIKRMLELSEQLQRLAAMEQEGLVAFEQAKADHERLEKLWIEGQAGLLADHLHDGKPCPVCGSETHPAKTSTRTHLPSREQLQQSKEQLSAIERELMSVKAQAASAISTRNTEITELEDVGLSIVLEGSHEEQWRELQKKQELLRQQWRELKGEADLVQKEANRLEELRAKLQEHERLLESLEQEREKLRAEQQKLIVERTAGQSRLQQELNRVPEALRSPEALKTKLKQQRERFEALEQAWKLAQERLQSAAAMLAEGKAYAEQAKRQAEEAEELASRTAERLLAELTKTGFADAQNYRDSVMKEAEIEAMKAELQKHRSAVEALTAGIASLELELAGKARSDTGELRQRLAELREKHEASIAAEQASRRFGDEALRLSQSIKRAGEKVKEIEARLERVTDVYAMLKGDNALKISFERYILIDYLEQILTMANIRLNELSNGQFQLRRSDRLESRGKQSGLGLDVYDAYTGQNRDVKSLSGGEKFNASLCLALGMTDVIQAHQGGVSIEMMLIDEGFGSLDEESLHKAIAALVDLQRAGRMIGVISHVGELKEAFPACLEVRKTKEGFSRASFILK